MSKITNSQRDITLREWISKNVKNKSKECSMYCDPSKRRVTHEAFGRHEQLVSPKDEELEVEVVIPIPHRK